MNLREQIAQDLKQAMLNKEELVRDTLRMLKSSLDTDPDANPIDVLTRAVKSRRDSASSYREGGRPELADKEEAEIAIIERYLPKSLGDEEAKAIIQALVEELGATTKKDTGRVMKALMDKYKGQIDGRKASELLGQLLSSAS